MSNKFKLTLKLSTISTVLLNAIRTCNDAEIRKIPVQ